VNKNTIKFYKEPKLCPIENQKISGRLAQ